MKPVKATERAYMQALRKIAKHVGGLIELYAHDGVLKNPHALQAALAKYAEELTPFAERVAAKMITATEKSVERQIKAQSKEAAKKMQVFLQSGTGRTAIDLQRAQVELIKSLPIDAGIRAQNLAMEAVAGGRRPADIAADILASGDVTESRAMLIARTESSRASAVITQSRAQSIGATHYIWRTAGDSDVRESHAEMDGKVVAYDDPPDLDGMTGHAGEFPNCRCYAEPILSGLDNQ